MISLECPIYEFLWVSKTRKNNQKKHKIKKSQVLAKLFFFSIKNYKGIFIYYNHKKFGNRVFLLNNRNLIVFFFEVFFEVFFFYC